MRDTRAKYSSWHPTALRQFSIGTGTFLVAAVVSAYLSWPDSGAVGCVALGAAVLAGALFVVLWPDTPYVTQRGEDPLVLLATLFVFVWFVGLFQLAGWFPLAVASSVGAADGLATLFFVFKYRHESASLVGSYGPHVPPRRERIPAQWSISSEEQSNGLESRTVERQMLQRVVSEVFADNVSVSYSDVESEERVLLRGRDNRRIAGLEIGPAQVALYLWDRGRFRYEVDTSMQAGVENQAVLRDLALLAPAYLRGEGRLDRGHIWSGRTAAYILTIDDQQYAVQRDPTADT